MMGRVLNNLLRAAHEGAFSKGGDAIRQQKRNGYITWLFYTHFFVRLVVA